MSHLSTTTHVEQDIEITTIVTKAQNERRKTINFNVDGGEDMVIDENPMSIPLSMEISGRTSVDPQFVHLEQCRNKTLMCNEDVDFTGVIPIVDKENIIPPPQVLNPLIVSDVNTGAVRMSERNEGIVNFIKRTRSMNVTESNISLCQQANVSTSIGHYNQNDEEFQNAPGPAFAPLDTTNDRKLISFIRNSSSHSTQEKIYTENMQIPQVMPPFINAFQSTNTDLQNKSIIDAIKRKKDEVYSPNPLMIPKKMCLNTTVNDMSMTKQLPANILVSEKNQYSYNIQPNSTALNYTNCTRDTSMQFTKQLPTNIHENLMFNNYTTHNISMESTQQLPIKLITNAGGHKHNSHRHLVFDEKSEIAGEMSMDFTKINPDVAEHAPNCQEFVDEKSTMDLTGETSSKLMEESNVQHFIEQVSKNQVLDSEKPALNTEEKISDMQISKTRTANELHSVEQISNNQDFVNEKSSMDITCKSSKLTVEIPNNRTEQVSNSNFKRFIQQIPRDQQTVSEKSTMDITSKSLKLMEVSNVQHSIEQVPKNQMFGNEKLALNVKEKISDQQNSRTANKLHSVEQISHDQECVNEKSAMDITCKSSKLIMEIPNKRTEQISNSNYHQFIQQIPNNQEIVEEKSTMEVTNVEHAVQEVFKNQVFGPALNATEKILDNQISKTVRTANVLHSAEQISNNQEYINEKSAMDIKCRSSNNQKFSLVGKFSNLAEEISSKQISKIPKPNAQPFIKQIPNNQEFVGEKSAINVRVNSSPKTDKHITKTAETCIPSYQRTAYENSAMDITDDSAIILTQNKSKEQSAGTTIPERNTLIPNTHLYKKDVLSLETISGETTTNIEVLEDNFNSAPEINSMILPFEREKQLQDLINLSKEKHSNQLLRNLSSVKDNFDIKTNNETDCLNATSNSITRQNSSIAPVKSPKGLSYVDQKMDCESEITMAENDVRNNEYSPNTAAEGNLADASDRKPFENTYFPSHEIEIKNDCMTQKVIPPSIIVNEQECTGYLQNSKSDIHLIEPKKIISESKESFVKADLSKRNIFTEVPNTDEIINEIQRDNPHFRTFNCEPSFSLNFNNLKQNEQTVCQISFNADNRSPKSCTKPSTNESKLTRELTISSPRASFAVSMPDAESFALSLDVTNENYNLRIESPKSRATLSPCTDDTQHLINYRLSGRKESQTEYSKIIAGDYKPYVNSKIMALNDSIPQFVGQSYKDDLSRATPKKDDSTSKMDISLLNDDELDSFANATMGAEKMVIEMRKSAAYEESVVEEKLQDELDVNEFLKEVRESLTKFSLPERKYYRFNQLMEEFEQMNCRLDEVVKEIDPDQCEADFNNLSSRFSIEPDSADNSKDCNNTETAPFFSQYDISEEENRKSLMDKIEEKSKRFV